jgi:hypothetical protein
MDVRLSSDQQAVRDSATQVVDRLGPRTVGQLDDRERSDRLDAAVASSGWRELRDADDGDAPLASGVEVALIAEELARGLADAPFTGPTLAAELRRRTGAPAATATETVGLTPTLSELTVAVDGALGSELVAVDADRSPSALVLVPAGGGHALAEVAVRPLDLRADLTRPAAGAAAGTVVRKLDGQVRALTADDLDAWTALGLALTSADLVGAMRGAIDLAVEYAGGRQQFGRPIGSFQAVQHLLADALVLMEGSRSIARHAAWAVDALPPSGAVEAAAMAKAYCARAARTVGEISIQVHGGIGNTWECLAHVYLRRALLSSQLLGGANASLDRVLALQGLGGDDGLH